MAYQNFENNESNSRPGTQNSVLSAFMFGGMFLYIIICIVMYFANNHVASYQVKEGSIYVNNSYKGIALRDEILVNSNDAGYVNYFAKEGSRIGSGKMVCTIDANGDLKEMLEEAAMGEEPLEDSDFDELRGEIISFKNEFSKDHFNTVYEFKNSALVTVMKSVNANVLRNMEKLNSSGNSFLRSNLSPRSGIVVYSYDDYEDLKPIDVTKDILSQKEYQKKLFLDNELVEHGDALYKLILNENWSIVIPLEDEEKADLLEEKEYVKVKFLKNQNTSWGKVTTWNNESGDYFAQLDFNNSMISFCKDRFIDLELILEEETGLKIPKSAIVTKEFFTVPFDFVNGDESNASVVKQSYTEDGTLGKKDVPITILKKTDSHYYIDSPELEMGDTLFKADSATTLTLDERGPLTGVYNRNKGYADFKIIQSTGYENEEYAIVKPDSEYGLLEYDYIVLDASTVKDDQLIIK